MLPIKRAIWCLACLFMVIVSACSSKPAETTEIMVYPVDSEEGILSEAGYEMDTEITFDGRGSVRITTSEPATVRLYETGDMDIENARLIYQAKLRTEDVEGQVYLEMLCDFAGKGVFFSRALQSSLSGTSDWVSQETPFFLKKGENPDNVKLNLVIDGAGTVWIDDIRLLRAPL